MTLRRFQMLLTGMSAQSVFVLAQRFDKPKKMLRGAAVDAYFATIGSI
jgi:hypothetical protein